MKSGLSASESLQNALRAELHTDIARMSIRGSLRTVENSSHHFQLDRPQEVTAAIVDVLHPAGGARLIARRWNRTTRRAPVGVFNDGSRRDRTEEMSYCS